MFGPRRVGLQSIQGVFVSQQLGALGHRAFLHDVVDVMDNRIGGDFTLRQAIQGFDFLGKPSE